MRTKKHYLLITGLGIACILLSVFSIYPFFKDIKKNSEMFFSERKKIMGFSQERENFKNIENLYKKYQSDLEKIGAFLIEPEIPLEFINFLEKTASSSQIKFNIVSMVKKAEKEDPWSSFNIQCAIIGPLPNSLRFLEKLENGPYLIEILDMDIRSAAGTGIGPAEKAISFSMKVFSK